MHPLCCIAIDCSGVTRGGRGWGGDGDGDFSPTPQSPNAEERNAGGGEVGGVAGVLYKWTNYGKGWRSRWFSLRNGVLSYSKIVDAAEGGGIRGFDAVGDGVRVIGDPARHHRIGGGGCRKPRKSVRVIRLKISSFRESRSDDRRFYIFCTTKTLYLKTDSKKDRTSWIEALLSARNVYPLKPLNAQIPLIQNSAPFTTEKLRRRLLEEGLNESLIKDCEHIMLSEVSQLKLLYEEHFSLLSFRQLEVADNPMVLLNLGSKWPLNADPFDVLTRYDCDLIVVLNIVLYTNQGKDKIAAEVSVEISNGQEANVDLESIGIQEPQLLIRSEFSSSRHGKYSEYSTTESSDEVERQELDERSAEDEPYYCDAKDSFSESGSEFDSVLRARNHFHNRENVENHPFNLEMMHWQPEISHHKYPLVERRKKLPDPIEKEKGVSLWSIIKDSVGKDLTRVCLPVYFNEPLSSLQKCFEDLEYSYLLDQAYEYGKMGNSLMRILNVAAFAVSGYASSDGRPCKPFNPLLGETYEADYPDKGVHFFSEKVSHQPMVIACHCEGRGWKFWGDSNLRSKFWGRSIQLDPVGVLTLEFDDGEIFHWSKVTTSIYNIIFGKIYCDHHGTMHICGNRQYSCKLKFKEQSILDRNPHQVQGYVEDVKGAKVANLVGKWDDSVYHVEGETKCSNSSQSGSLLWKRDQPPPYPTRYNLSSFAITLNELTSELLEKLPPTDSRRRPDQRHLENGEYEKANIEKLRLEKRQRMSRKLQESGWKPRWFCRDGEDGTFRYVGGYWEAREQKNWDGCPDIFGEFSNDSDALSFK